MQKTKPFLNRPAKTVSVLASFCLAIVLAGVLGLVVAKPAQAAASLYFSPSGGTYQAGKSVAVNVLLSTSEAANALSGTIAFDRTIMEVSSVSRSGSKVSFWVKDPSFSNSSGSVSFEGIIPNPGYTGSGGKIITINFRFKAEGEGTVRFTGGQVLANDGNGTNITGGLGSAKFTVGKTASEPAQPAVPTAPVISSSTHPDANLWYANSEPQFKWSVPSGVTAVATAVNDNPNGDPGTSATSVSSSLNLRNQKNGVQYVHVRFRNKQGWGPVGRYKFQIDKEAPSDIKLEKQGEFYSITSTDAYSGVDHYEWQEDEGNFNKLEPKEGLYDFSMLSAGDHTITLRSVDKAGNVADKDVEITIPVPEAVIPNADFSYAWLWILAGLLALLLVLAVLRHRFVAPELGSNAMYLALADDMMEQIRILEHAKAERKLTKEETKLLKHIHLSLQKVEKLIGPENSKSKKVSKRGLKFSYNLDS